MQRWAVVEAGADRPAYITLSRTYARYLVFVLSSCRHPFFVMPWTPERPR